MDSLGAVKGSVGKMILDISEDVLVDRRGYVYRTDKNRGLLVLRYRGELR